MPKYSEGELKKFRDSLQDMRFFKSYWKAIEKLDKSEDKAAIYSAILAYYFEGKEPELSGVTSAFFDLMRPAIDGSLQKRKANSDNGKKGGRPPKGTDKENPNES